MNTRTAVRNLLTEDVDASVDAIKEYIWNRFAFQDRTLPNHLNSTIGTYNPDDQETIDSIIEAINFVSACVERSEPNELDAEYEVFRTEIWECINAEDNDTHIAFDNELLIKRIAADIIKSMRVDMHQMNAASNEDVTLAVEDIREPLEKIIKSMWGLCSVAELSVFQNISLVHRTLSEIQLMTVHHINN